MTDATKCTRCGGEFSAKRVHIDGKAYHHACVLASYPSHTPDDMLRVGGEMARLRVALQVAHDWLIKRENQDLPGSDAVYIAVVSALNEQKAASE